MLTFGSPSEHHFSIAEDGLSISLNAVVGFEEVAVEEVVDGALERVAALETGGFVIYREEMTISSQQLLDVGGIHFVRVLGDQVHIEGPRRLADVAILEFEEGLLGDAVEVDIPFAPDSKVHVSVFIPGPTHSDFTLLAATNTLELVAAICALGTGRPVSHLAPVFDASENEAATAEKQRRDSHILGLARDSISLDVFGDLISLGGADAFLRARGSLLAYHAALKQTSPDVVVMLLVTSIEALIAPRASWGKSRVMSRFVRSLIELCPAAVDDLLGHANTAKAFGFKKRGGLQRQRRELLNLIYEARSLPTHTGLSPSPAGLTMVGGTSGSSRVALLSDLARSAILSYLQAPRSSIVGFPAAGSMGLVEVD